MKKLLVVAAFAFIFAACGGPKETGICVDKFYENTIENLGKEITLVGQAKVCCCSGAIMIVNCEATKSIRVVPVEGTVVPENVKDAILQVKGIVSEEVIDETCVAAMMEKATAMEDGEEKEAALAKATKVEEMIATEGVIRNYVINATSIEIAKAPACDKKCCSEKKDGCAKECEKKCCGEKKDGCAKECDKKCDEHKEGCEKKCEGKTETTATE